MFRCGIVSLDARMVWRQKLNHANPACTEKVEFYHMQIHSTGSFVALQRVSRMFLSWLKVRSILFNVSDSMIHCFTVLLVACPCDRIRTNELQIRLGTGTIWWRPVPAWCESRAPNPKFGVPRTDQAASFNSNHIFETHSNCTSSFDWMQKYEIFEGILKVVAWSMSIDRVIIRGTKTPVSGKLRKFKKRIYLMPKVEKTVKSLEENTRPIIWKNDYKDDNSGSPNPRRWKQSLRFK